MKIRWKLLGEDGEDPENYAVWKFDKLLPAREKIGDAMVLHITEVSTSDLDAIKSWWCYRCYRM